MRKQHNCDKHWYVTAGERRETAKCEKAWKLQFQKTHLDNELKKGDKRELNSKKEKGN